MEKKLVLRGLILLLAITIPIISTIVLALEDNPMFTWCSNSVTIGSMAYGKGCIEVIPIFGISSVHFAVVTNYSINGVVMPKFKITGNINGLPPVEVVAAKWGKTTVWAAAYYGVWFIPKPKTIGYRIAQPIPPDTRLIGQELYGAAGSIDLNITPWWHRTISIGEGLPYSFHKIEITGNYETFFYTV